MNIPMTAGTTTLAKVRTRIKVCGLTRIADAEAAVMHGADALGLIFWKPSPRYIDPLAARPLVSCAGPFVATVGVFVDPTRDEVLRAIEQAGLSHRARAMVSELAHGERRQLELAMVLVADQGGGPFSEVSVQAFGKTVQCIERALATPHERAQLVREVLRALGTPTSLLAA